MKKQKKREATIKKILDDFWKRMLALNACVNLYIPLAGEFQKSNGEEYTKQIDALAKKLKSKSKKTREEAEIKLRKVNRKYQWWLTGNHTSILTRSTFLYIFSEYDALVGNLLNYIYENKKEQQKTIEKTFTYEDIIGFSTIKEVKNLLIDKHIDTFRRESYSDQFKILEKRFRFKTLRRFENWPLFIEASQRRHLFTHCDGLVSSQYIKNCEEEGYLFDKKPKIGDKLLLLQDYHNKTIDVVTEVGIKLGTTLWKKLWVEELEMCDSYLENVVVEMISNRRYFLAEEIAKFAYHQHKVSNDMHKKIYLINYAQSLKWNKKEKECEKILKCVDWSSCQEDFKLAVAVLLSEWDNAIRYMLKIGKKSELIDKNAYIEWPLFREFRKRDDFRKTFKEIYKKDFENFELEKSKKPIQEKT